MKREWAPACRLRKATLTNDELRRSLELAEEAISVDPFHRDASRIELAASPRWHSRSGGKPIERSTKQGRRQGSDCLDFFVDGGHRYIDHVQSRSQV